jgi:hypothetical protein
MDSGIVCDREQMQDLWELMDDLRDALEVYCGLTRPPRTPARRSRTKVPSASA